MRRRHAASTAIDDGPHPLSARFLVAVAEGHADVFLFPVKILKNGNLSDVALQRGMNFAFLQHAATA
ncbi:hypothetical protein NXT3_PB00188 (plasmid) [Sinorhizobium fredii]|uniref:Uncharacterized protein n=1 Tax=Rhizobium fredii TaxID=380 RepID=A0A2L0HDM5_RHIFR|nr:hypothetical protein NXT3_PB00188 [Sinorhizobium fredii]